MNEKTRTSPHTLDDYRKAQAYYDPPNAHTLRETSEHTGISVGSLCNNIQTRPRDNHLRKTNNRRHRKRKKRIKRAALLRFEAGLSAEEAAAEQGVALSTHYSYIRSYRKGRYTTKGADSSVYRSKDC